MRTIVTFSLSVTLFMFLLTSVYAEKPDISIMNLADSTWQFTELGQNKWEKASVPGCVQMDLYYNGDIEDPYYRDNEEKLQWIGKKDWEYASTFQVTEDILRHKNVELDFKGLDTYADVYLNGSFILSANNFFRSWKVDCKKFLKVGKNRLRIVFTSSIKINKKKAKEYPYGKPVTEYAFTRKPAYHYGWDWGPVYVTSGIWQPIYLKAWDCAKINDMHVIQKRVSRKRALLAFKFEISSTKEQEAVITVNSKILDKTLNKRTWLKKGTNFVELNLEIKNPRLWWTNGLGTPFLYDFTGELIVEGKLKDRLSKKIGIRKLRVVEKKDKLGSTFYIELNNVPVFMKGANYIPQDMFLNRPSDKDYEKLIQQAVSANMNMLRVWGGGLYEKDIFYDLCDRYGILVWQDFMFACSMYPGDKEFLDNVKEEAIENVKRLRDHVCIALWCGNNENYVGWKNWGWPKMYSKKDSAAVWHDYLKLFEELLPSVVKKYDPGRFYWPSSPGGSRPLYAAGDVHYWDVWHGQKPFESFEKKQNIGRFMSEYGFQGTPEFKSVKEFTIPEDWNISSAVMKNHQKHRIGYPVIDKYMKWDYKMPEDFKSYLYISQLLQARGIKTAIEAHRRAKPFCMGTLYWQLNDCWPVTSWSSIDYYGRWKALHYYVKKVYNQILVSPFVENKKLDIYIISDKLENIYGKISLWLKNFDGATLWNYSSDVKIDANTSKPYFSTELEKLVGENDTCSIVLEAEVKEGKKVLSKNLFYFAKPKNLKLKKPLITFRHMKTEKGYRFEFTTDRLAKNLFLSFENHNGFFTDNYFDLIPGETKVVDFITDEKISNIREKLKIRTLF